MAIFSKRSIEKLGTCHPDLQMIMQHAIRVMDFSILCGHRGKGEQWRLYQDGKTKLNYPNSKHNKTPSLAVDIAPYPIDWSDRKRFYYLAGVVEGIADQLLRDGVITHKIRWGGDWNRNHNFNDQTFFDLPHIELVEV
jgi:peptidoglycan L-alanyl-D-glutamate endopeptidase CwlK